MTNEATTTAAGAIGSRLALALEQFLQTTSKRDDHLVKLLTVMAKLLADSRPTPVDLAPLAAAIEQAAGRTPPEQQHDDDASEALQRSYAAFYTLANEVRAAIRDIAEVLQRQTDMNDLVLRLTSDQDQRLGALEAEVPGVEPRSLDETAAEPCDEEAQAFLRQSEIFGPLSDEALGRVLASGHIETYGAGATVFGLGEPIAAVHIVRSGIVEVCAPGDEPNELSVIAYLTSGDSIGEMSALIPNEVRSSVGRVPESADALVIEREAFLRLLDDVPEVATRLASVFALRLRSGASRVQSPARQRELRGSLRYFDLTEVVQALLSSDERTGSMTVRASTDEVIAEFYLDAGYVRYARLGRLEGEEAFFQLFQTDLSGGTFHFREDAPPEALGETAEIHTPGTSLLYEAARLAAELPSFREIIPDPDRIYTATTDTLELEDGAPRDAAEEMWGMLRDGASAARMVEQLPRSQQAVYRVLAQLIHSGKVK